jgi:hypothetical protein
VSSIKTEFFSVETTSDIEAFGRLAAAALAPALEV